MQCMTLNRYKITEHVRLSEIPIVHDIDRSFCPIFFKFEM